MQDTSTENKLRIEFQQFFQEHYKRFVLQAIRIVKEGPKAEDLVQECFIKLWDKRAEIAFDDSSLGYFHRMVRNKCIDYLRSLKTTLEIDNESYQSISNNTISSNLEFKEFQTKVDNAIDALPERCRQVFVLSRFEEMSYKEIAAQLEISTKTVENQISKALKQLRSKLLSILFSTFF